MTAYFLRLLRLFACMELLSSAALAQVHESGGTARVGVGVATGVVGLKYDGPSNAQGDGEEGWKPELVLASQHPFVALEGALGIGYWLDNHRFGIDISALSGPTLGQSGEAPHTDFFQVAALSFGPSYSYAFSVKSELDVSARATVLTLLGGRDDIGAYDNVIETPAHWGAIVRIAGICRPKPQGTFALTTALSGGPQYSGYQMTYLASWMLGVQWN